MSDKKQQNAIELYITTNLIDVYTYKNQTSCEVFKLTIGFTIDIQQLAWVQAS